MTQAYPLQWPIGKKRTLRPQRSAFKQTQEAAQQMLVAEVRRLGGRRLVLSTNIAIRGDGLPYSRQPRSAYDDPGVAVYFDLSRNGMPQQMVFACDRWDKIGDNIYAIAKTIEALRGIERWGSGDMVQAAFTGFEALPPPAGERPWREVFAEFGFPRIDRVEGLEVAYRKASMSAHPDQGGDHDKMADLNRARDTARRELAA